MFSSFKKNIFFCFLFFLLLLEDKIRFGALTLSNIWKISVTMIFLLFVIDKILRKEGGSKFVIITFLFSFSLLINSNGFFAFEDVQEVLIFLIFPISYFSFYYLNKNDNPYKIADNLLLLSCFLIFTSIPFILGIIEQTKADNIEAEIYGLDDKIMVGFFKHPAIASKIFVCSALFIYLYGLNVKTKITKLILWLFFAVGSYCVYMSFTRTGWFMLLFGIVFSLVYKKKVKTYIFKVIPILFILIFAVSFIYNNNESVQRRLNGERIGRENSQVDETDMLTSGRNVLIENAISSVYSEGIQALIFGIGVKKSIESNDGAVAHNRFAEVFQYGGFLSLILFVFYIKAVYTEIKRYKTNTYIYSINILFFILLIISFIPSHGFPIWIDLLFGGTLATNRILYEQQLKLKNEVTV